MKTPMTAMQQTEDDMGSNILKWVFTVSGGGTFSLLAGQWISLVAWHPRSPTASSFPMASH